MKIGWGEKTFGEKESEIVKEINILDKNNCNEQTLTENRKTCDRGKIRNLMKGEIFGKKYGEKWELVKIRWGEKIYLGKRKYNW